ncbi:hypothetical protein JCM11491_000132 [Sporobolomyces phaffii]
MPMPTSPRSDTARDLDRRFKTWTRYISRKLSLSRTASQQRGDADDPVLNLDEVVPIARSVIVTAEGEGEAAKAEPELPVVPRPTLDHQAAPLDHRAFLEIVESARHAIANGVEPRLNQKGSSGSYFVRDATNTATLAIFKPSDEDPYGHSNPKLLKRVHRRLHLVAPRVVPFGRTCLVPGQSDRSEAAASVLDRHLGTSIVPRTEVVTLDSRAFHHASPDRDGSNKTKEGSFQVFLKGFTDASDFFARYPYPPAARSSTTETRPHSRRRRSIWSTCLPCWGRSDDEPSVRGGRPGEDSPLLLPPPPPPPPFEWTRDMVASFQLELEHLVVLDYLLRNTDRGLDNFMIKPCAVGVGSGGGGGGGPPHVHVAAIDNSLAFPHRHPRGWREYLFGWLYLPRALLDHAWSDPTRRLVRSTLESPAWWAELHRDLRATFRPRHQRGEDGDDWNEAAWKAHPDEGPLELCRRPKVVVWDDHVLVPDDDADDVVGEEEPAPPTSSSVSVSYSRIPAPPPPPPSLAHRRTHSDYTVGTSTYGGSGQRSAEYLRRPLDALAASSSLTRNPFQRRRRRVFERPGGDPSPLDDLRRDSSGGDGGEEEGETGFAFLRRLDASESVELERARKVERDAERRGLLGEGRRDERTRGPRSRSGGSNETDETSRLLLPVNSDEDEDDKSSSGAEVDDDEARGGRGWGTTSEIVLPSDGRTATRSSRSWYDANGVDPVPSPTREAEQGAAGNTRSKVQGKKWVVHERLEFVPEPKRRFRLPW